MKQLKELADFIVDFRLADADPEVIRAAKYCILDTIGQALGARDNKMLCRIRDVYHTYDGDGTLPGQPEFSVLPRHAGSFSDLIRIR